MKFTEYGNKPPVCPLCGNKKLFSQREIVETKDLKTGKRTEKSSHYTLSCPKCGQLRPRRFCYSCKKYFTEDIWGLCSECEKRVIEKKALMDSKMRMVFRSHMLEEGFAQWIIEEHLVKGTWKRPREEWPSMDSHYAQVRG